MPHRVIKFTFRRDYHDSRSRGKNERLSNEEFLRNIFKHTVLSQDAKRKTSKT